MKPTETYDQRRYASQYALWGILNNKRNQLEQHPWPQGPAPSASLWCRVAPVPMEHPRGFLTVFAAVLGAATTSALGKLALEFLPFATLVVCALADPTARFVLAAQIPHHHACPVTHVFRVVTDRELFYQWEDVHVVREEVFVLFRTVDWGGAVAVATAVTAVGIIQHAELAVNLEFRHQVRILEE